jgi:glycosyltransferase involved in cell wall biosynthesis
VLFVVYRDFENPEAVGGDFYLWELARGLSRLGHSVTLVCSSFVGSKPLERRDGVEIIRVKGSLSLPLRLFKTYLQRAKGCFDVVIEEALGGQRFPFLCGLYVGEPLVAVWHQRNARVFREQYPFFVALPLSFFEFVLARVYRGKTVLTPSMGAKAKLALLGLRDGRVKVVYDGVGEEFVDLGLGGEREDVVVCLGKLRRYKRIDHAVLAHGKVVERVGKPVKLVVAGKLSEIDRGHVGWLRSLAERLGIAGLVEFRVNISEREKVELLRGARVLVQPSPVEGFSIVVAEANRCGTPVVVSDGVPFDVVRDGVNGLVYRFGDIDAFAAGIFKLLSDDDAWSEMSKNAYEWSKQFTWKSSAFKFERILKDLR